MTATTRLMTVDDLEQRGAPEGRWELINGELVEMSPAGEYHGAWMTARHERIARDQSLFISIASFS